MKNLYFLMILVLVLQAFAFNSAAQVIPQTPEMREQINEMKKEIKMLEEEMKAAEQSDPEEAKMLKTQLDAMKSMMQMLEPTPSKKTTSTKESIPTAKVPVKQAIISPIVPVTLTQPVAAPTPQQAKDRLLWYRGKKVNDSTLVTSLGMVVQLSKSRNIVKLRPEVKTDPFAKIVQEVEKNEQRKEELIVKIEGLQNGFLYYPELVKALKEYDRLAKDFGAAVKNTIDLPPLPDFSATGYVQPAGHGPNAGDFLFDFLAEEDVLKNISGYMNQKLERAKKMFSELPPVGEFPPPPPHYLGMCFSCDPETEKKIKEQDSIWTKQYQGRESEIFMLILEVERAQELRNAKLVTDTTNYFRTIGIPLMTRMKEKNKLLQSRYGNDIRYKQIVSQTVLGLERQAQLLGSEQADSGVVFDVADGMDDLYLTYFDEQAQAKNHDFVLNMSSHLGMARQAALLGVDINDDNSLFSKLLEKYKSYNRFGLTAEIDFIYEKRSDDNELEFKTTGKLETTVKQFIMFYPDLCSFKVQPYNKDLQKVELSDMSLPFTVTSGAKTYLDENNELVTVQYSGPQEYPLAFPDFKIEFCNNSIPDTAFFLTFTGNEEAAIMVQAGLSNLNSKYTTDLISYANFVFLGDEEVEQNETDLENLGMDMMKNIVGFQTQKPDATVLGRMKQAYDGKTKMDNMRKSMQGMMTSKKSQFLFTANNKSTVLVDKYNDSKRQLEEGVNLIRGMMHLRIVHQPVE